MNETSKIAVGGTGATEKGISGGNESPRRVKRASSFSTQHGTRVIKGYLITEKELRHLFGIGFISAVAFSVMTGCIGFALDTWRDIQFSADVNKDILLNWQIFMVASVAMAVLAALGGCASLYLGQTTIREIQRQTDFGD